MSSKDIQKKLDRFKSQIVTGKQPKKPPPLPSRYQTMADALGGELVRGDGGIYCLVKTLYPFGSTLGSCELAQPSSDPLYPKSAFSAREEEGAVPVSSLVYFDIETTGLGGTGAVAFLIGCGSLTPEGFEVRQYMLPDYTDETAMLEAVLEELSRDKVIVSYNGAAFDMTMVRDRMIINRVAREIITDGHLDLLHSTRRLFRRRLGDCSLTNIERELFGYHRVGDIPGYLIPSIYFEWLASENLETMDTVLEHNRLDIFSLYFLAEMISGIFDSEGETLDEIDDMHSLSRIYERRKDRRKVLDICSRIEAEGTEFPPDMLFFHSMALKREGRLDDAVEAWHKLADLRSREGFLANIELAKLYEHRVRDYQKAFECTLKAEKNCPPGKSFHDAVDKRISRLSARLK